MSKDTAALIAAALAVMSADSRAAHMSDYATHADFRVLRMAIAQLRAAVAQAEGR